MNTPIKREDIRKGDRIRVITEFTATTDDNQPGSDVMTYELIERPVQLPTEPGWYGSGSQSDVSGLLLLTRSGSWHWVGNVHAVSPEQLDKEYVEAHAPLTLLRPVADVAAEVLAEVHGIFGGPGALLHGKVDKIAERWAAK